MGSTTSKTKSTTISPLASTKRASKRILKRNSAIYPTTQQQQNPSHPQHHSVDNCNNVENNNNININHDDNTIVIRNKSTTVNSNGDLSAPTTPKNVKKEKSKKKRNDNAVSGDESAPAYHQTNVCYYKVENGTFLKLPNDTKHKSNDGCYVKLSNGSFRHLMVPDGAGSRPEVNFKPDGGVNDKKNNRQSMPVPPKNTNLVNGEEKAVEKNRKVMVTMIDGGLPVVAVSKRDKTANLAKKEKIKVLLTILTAKKYLKLFLRLIFLILSSHPLEN
jgi:hypothetical protein